jgi:hypothetical protein
VIDPWWPVAGLAAVQVVDAALCWKPVGFIAQCFRDVHFPRRYWPVMTPLKLAAAAGLLVGIWWQPLAVITSACLVAYFVLAVAMHIRARDFGRNLFMNATGMLVISIATFVFTLASKP